MITNIEYRHEISISIDLFEMYAQMAETKFVNTPKRVPKVSFSILGSRESTEGRKGEVNVKHGTHRMYCYYKCKLCEDVYKETSQKIQRILLDYQLHKTEMHLVLHKIK